MANKKNNKGDAYGGGTKDNPIYTPINGPDPTGAVGNANNWLSNGQQWPPTSPTGPTGPTGQGGPPPDGGGDNQCQMICEPPDPYALNAGSQPMGFEGYVSAYADPQLSEGIGAGSQAANSGFDFNTYVQQEQAYESDWMNYQNAMRNGITPAGQSAAATPAAGQTTSWQDALAKQQQGYGY